MYLVMLGLGKLWRMTRLRIWDFLFVQGDRNLQRIIVNDENQLFALRVILQSFDLMQFRNVNTHCTMKFALRISIVLSRHKRRKWTIDQNCVAKLPYKILLFIFSIFEIVSYSLSKYCSTT